MDADKPLPRDPFLVDLQRMHPAYEVRCIFDVGANVGQSTDRYRRACPSAQVHAFEPVRASYEALQGRFADDRQVRCRHLALGRRGNTRVRIRAKGTAADNHIVTDVADNAAGFPLETVAQESGEAYCAAQGVNWIDLLKIDTEGHDLDVLQGFLALLRAHRVAFVQVEASMNPENRRHVPFAAFVELLQPLGFYLFGFYDQVRELRDGRPALRRSNPVFVCQKLKPWPRVPRRKIPVA